MRSRLIIAWRRLRKLLGFRSRIYDIYGRPFTKKQAQACVGRGWAGLVSEAYDAFLDGACIAQVKEKFGELCFYYHDVVDHPEIDEIERRSGEVCERCGAPGFNAPLKEGGYWLVTLCEACRRQL